MLISLLRQIYSKAPSRVTEDAYPTAYDPAPGEAWLRGLIVQMFQLIHTVEQDNFEAERYRGVDSNAFFFEEHAAYFAFLLKNTAQFYQARMLLTDVASRALYDQLILFRLLGHLHVRLPFNNQHNRAQIAVAMEWAKHQTSDVGGFGPLWIYEVPGDGNHIRIKGWIWNVVWTFLYRQYYFERGGIRIAPAPGDHVIDAGACFGDTALGFADVVGDRGHVYAFDPMPKHCAIMREVVAMNLTLAPRISILPFGLTDQVNEAMPLTEGGEIDPGARISFDAMPTTTLDEVTTHNTVPRLDFIKMDIEGSELAALRGAETSIRRWTPKLAISLYHRPEDFFSIPLWIDSLGVGYRFFLDHYSIHREETVLYASV